DGRKIGRSRVTGNCVSGIAQSGLALSAFSGAAGGGCDGGIVTCVTVVVGSVQFDGTAAFARAPSAWSSTAGSEPAENAAGAPAPSTNANSAVAVLNPCLLFSRLAIDPTLPEVRAASLPPTAPECRADRRTRTAFPPPDHKATAAAPLARPRSSRS